MNMISKGMLTNPVTKSHTARLSKGKFDKVCRCRLFQKRTTTNRFVATIAIDSGTSLATSLYACSFWAELVLLSDIVPGLERHLNGLVDIELFADYSTLFCHRKCSEIMRPWSVHV